MPNTYVALAKTVLTTSQTSVSFTSINANYTDLCIVISARTSYATIADFMYLVVNSNTNTVYSYLQLQGNNSTATSARSTSDPRFIIPYGYPGASATSDTFGSIEIYIPNYTSSENRSILITAVSENNSTAADNAYIQCMAELYRNTTAISSIEINASSGSFVSNSSFYLYGIKNS